MRQFGSQANRRRTLMFYIFICVFDFCYIPERFRSILNPMLSIIVTPKQKNLVCIGLLPTNLLEVTYTKLWDNAMIHCPVNKYLHQAAIQPLVKLNAKI